MSFQDDLHGNTKYLYLVGDLGGSPITDAGTQRGATFDLGATKITGDAQMIVAVGGEALAASGATITVALLHGDISTVGDTLLPGSTVVVASGGNIGRVKVPVTGRKLWVQARVTIAYGGGGGTDVPFTAVLEGTGQYLPLTA